MPGLDAATSTTSRSPRLCTGVSVTFRPSATTAVNAGSLTNVTTMAGGNGFSLAVTSNGTAWSWGNNANGQLGTGNTTSRITPGRVSGISTAIAVAGGNAHGLALLSDGTIRSWGYNISGQLGDGTNTQRNSPVAVSTLTNIVAIATGHSHRSLSIHRGRCGRRARTATDRSAMAPPPDPFLADTDGDGYNDKVDAFPLDPTRHAPLPPVPVDTTPPVITLTEPTNAVPLN